VATQTDASPIDPGAGLVDALATRLHARVLEGTIPLGTWLRQETIATEFGVSRTPVREALRKLQSAGVVELHAHRGALVRGPSAREIREAYVVRAELEGLAAELAAGTLTSEHRARVRKAAALFEPGMQGEEWSDANTRFHEAILDAAGNGRLHRAVSELHRSFPRNLTWAALAQRADLLRRNVEEHEAILAALERGDAVAGRAAMREHVLSAGEAVTAWFLASGGREHT